MQRQFRTVNATTTANRLPDGPPTRTCAAGLARGERLRAAPPRLLARGFTLIELLIVVSMIGVLSAIAVVGYRKYLHSSQSSEATAMLGSIRNAQEGFKAEAMSYLAVSGSAGNDLSGADLYPRAVGDLNDGKVNWVNTTHSDFANWARLGASAEGPVRFGYGCVAAFPGDDLPGAVFQAADPNWSAAFGGDPPNEPWFVAVAVGDRDDDGQNAVFQTASFRTEILVHEDTE